MFSPTAVPFHHLEGVRLALHTPEETKKLSVKKLTNPETFDALLHPNFGGLYDPALGPTDKDDLCGTCAQNYIYCPGHFGHLELPLPVYHPLFFKELLQILRSSCFKCGDLLFSSTVRHVFVWWVCMYCICTKPNSQSCSRHIGLRSAQIADCRLQAGYKIPD